MKDEREFPAVGWIVIVVSLVMGFSLGCAWSSQGAPLVREWLGIEARSCE